MRRASRRLLSLAVLKRLGLALVWLALVWLALVGSFGSALAEDEFLPPEQAFRPSARAIDAERIALRWDIAPGYYLYAAKFQLASNTPEIALGQPEWPPAEIKHDAFFGEVGIHRAPGVEARIPLTRAAGAGDRLQLQVRYQGCAEAGFCYPPQTATLAVALPPLIAGSPVEPLMPRAALLGARAGLFGGEAEIPSAEEAFHLTAQILAPDRLRLDWHIAPETYLYRDEIRLRLEGAAPVALGSFALPAADIVEDSVRPDGSIGAVAVYRQDLVVEVPLRRGESATAETTLVAQFQGCHARGICYPPVTQRIALHLPPASETVALDDQPDAAANAGLVAAGTAAPPRQAEADRLADRLARGGLRGAFALFFGLGLLLALTPCVFPMIPILSGIIAGQGQHLSTRQAFWLSLAYVLAMALTYALIGVIAGLFGANLQASFQHPWVLSLFAAIFVALALSMFGFYELQLPSALQTRLTQLGNRQRGGTLAGAAIMGALSALIVGPCLAPPLMGALIFIGKTGNALLGFVALLALGLGMGAPLLLIGTSAGHLLPRAGAWMDGVKAVFGVLLLGVAIGMLERLLPAAAAMALWGLLLLGSGVYLGALTPLAPEANGWRKLWKTLGLALLVYGVLMLVGAAAGGRDTLQPLRGLAQASAPQGALFTPIKTLVDLDRELANARALGRPVMLDFYADWCVSCKELERNTLRDPTVLAELRRFVLLRADVTANDAADRALLRDRFGLPGPPAMLFFDAAGAAAGNERRGDRLVGYVPPAAFAAHLREVAR